ncbi:MAG: glycosyltransferase [Candidatus Coatesbacteria bacterium]|nr:glycosyltransferase [Candidatus Coatesbacteria bacterium]
MISVVIPTYNSRGFLAACLEGLLEQDHNPSEFEVIISDDGSNDGTASLVESLAPRFAARGISLEYLHNIRGGAGAARNAGILASKGEIVAFTDADCVPGKSWLSAIDCYFSNHPEHLGVGGKTISEPEHITPFTHQVENTLEYSYPTCNVAYRRDTLLEVGMFEVTFPYPNCRFLGTPDNEDWDITFKVESIGEIGFSNDALVVHPPRPTTMRKLLTRTRNLESEFYLYERHPSLYRKSVHRHPLRVLLYHRALVQPALKLFRFRRFIYARPLLYLKMVVLLCLQTVYIWILTPFFLVRHLARKRLSSPWGLP